MDEHLEYQLKKLALYIKKLADIAESKDCFTEEEKYELNHISASVDLDFELYNFKE